MMLKGGPPVLPVSDPEISDTGDMFFTPGRPPHPDLSPQPGPSGVAPSAPPGFDKDAAIALRFASLEASVQELIHFQNLRNQEEVESTPEVVSSGDDFIDINLDEPDQFPLESEVLEYLVNRSLPISGKFALPPDWSIYRDGFDQPFLDIPFFGKVKPPLFQDLGVEGGERKVCFFFTSGQFQPFVPSTALSVTMGREYDALAKSAPASMKLRQVEKSEKAFGSSRGFFEFKPEGDVLSILNEDFLDQAGATSIPDFAKATWVANFTWQGDRIGVIPPVLMGPELSADQLKKESFSARFDHAKVSAEYHARHMLSAAWSIAIQADVMDRSAAALSEQAAEGLSMKIEEFRAGGAALRRQALAGIGPALWTWLRAKRDLRMSGLGTCPLSVFRELLLRSSPFSPFIFDPDTLKELLLLARAKGFSAYYLLANPNFPTLAKSSRSRGTSRGRGTRGKARGSKQKVLDKTSSSQKTAPQGSGTGKQSQKLKKKTSFSQGARPSNRGGKSRWGADPSAPSA